MKQLRFGLLATLIFAFSLSYADPTPVSCGDVLLTPGNYVLTSDLLCNPTAITIAASKVHLDMQGYSITSALPIVLGRWGINIIGTGAHVVNGSLHGFDLGIIVTGDDNKISDISASGNRWGILLCCDATGNRVTGNTTNFNVSGGIIDWQGGRNNVISGNTANWNDGFGVILEDLEGNPPKGDKVTGNTTNYNAIGILLWRNSDGNTVRGNEVIGNADWGVLSTFDPALGPGIPDDNVIQGNTVLDSGIGDIADFNPVCTNTWKNNTFVTEAGTDLSCTD